MEIETFAGMHAGERELGMINTTDLSTQIIQSDRQVREFAAELRTWVDRTRRPASMFDRGVFTPPNNPYDEMRTAKHALRNDNIVAGVAEITEAYAFQGVKWESEDPDDADVFNQLARDMNLDAVVRRMWRDEFTYSQFVAAKSWGWRIYTPRGTGKGGRTRRTKKRIWAPLEVRVLDSTKIVPVGQSPLGGDMLAWMANDEEMDAYRKAYAGDVFDPIMLSFFMGSYIPGFLEAQQLARLGVDTTRLLALNPQWVFRHTLTKPDYEPFADVRLKSVFSLLDLKHQLMASDRASLIGSANYILLIRKGTEKQPASQPEIDNLKENYNFIAKMPVIISDHRLEIEIIAPKIDLTLNSEKYDVIDTRLLARLLGTLSISGRGQRNETQETLSSAVAQVMQNRRHMLKRTIEMEIARAVVDHPKNAGQFTSEPNLVYTPRSIALALDATYIQALVALRTQREISRDTTLEFFALDQATEAQRLEVEAERYDDIFKTQIPFAAQGVNGGGDGATTPNGTAEAPAVSGARGGRPKGGGKTPASPQKQVTGRGPGGNPTTKKGSQ